MVKGGSGNARGRGEIEGGGGSPEGAVVSLCVTKKKGCRAGLGGVATGMEKCTAKKLGRGGVKQGEALTRRGTKLRGTSGEQTLGGR